MKITLTYIKSKEKDFFAIVDLPTLPRTGDRMYAYDLFAASRLVDIEETGLKKSTILIVSSVDWIFTGQAYRINLNLVLPGPDASEIFKSTFGVDLSFLSEPFQVQQETVSDKSRQ